MGRPPMYSSDMIWIVLVNARPCSVLSNAVFFICYWLFVQTKRLNFSALYSFSSKSRDLELVSERKKCLQNFGFLQIRFSIYWSLTIFPKYSTLAFSAEGVSILFGRTSDVCRNCWSWNRGNRMIGWKEVMMKQFGQLSGPTGWEVWRI